jgi:hypothetical protein
MKPQTRWIVSYYKEKLGEARTLSQATTIAVGCDDRFKRRRLSYGTYFDMHTGIKIERVRHKASRSKS